MKKGTYYILSISSFILCLVQWSPWAPWPVKEEAPVVQETVAAESPAGEAPDAQAKSDTPEAPATGEAAEKTPAGKEEKKKTPWKPVLVYLGLGVHWFGIEQHFWISILASCAITFLAAAVFLGEDDDDDDEDDEDF